MKVVLLSLCSLFFLIACTDTTPTPKVETAAQATEVKAEEDCEDKAKKPIEIKEETISLSGNTGCTLEE